MKQKIKQSIMHFRYKLVYITILIVENIENGRKFNAVLNLGGQMGNQYTKLINSEL